MQSNEPGKLIMPSLSLPSGITIGDPHGRLVRFSREEYDYYDGIKDSDPDRILAVDVLVTWSVNSRIYEVNPKKPSPDPATKLRNIHRGLASQCNPIMSSIPADADILSRDSDFQQAGNLLRQAIEVSGVGVAVATKVLHRKRRNFIPMLDNVVLKHYLTAEEIGSLNERSNWNNKELTVSLALQALGAFRDDLRNQSNEIEKLRRALNGLSFDLSPVRILEILVWTELRKFYRS